MLYYRRPRSTSCSVILQWQRLCELSFCTRMCMSFALVRKELPSEGGPHCDLTHRPTSFGAHEVNWSLWGWWRDECGVSICIDWTDWLTSTKTLLAPALRTFGRSSSIIPLPASIRGNWQPLLSLHFVAVLCRICGFAKRTWMTALYWLLLADSQRVTNLLNLTNISYRRSGYTLHVGYSDHLKKRILTYMYNKTLIVIGNWLIMKLVLPKYTQFCFKGQGHWNERGIQISGFSFLVNTSLLKTCK